MRLFFTLAAFGSELVMQVSVTEIVWRNIEINVSGKCVTAATPGQLDKDEPLSTHRNNYSEVLAFYDKVPIGTKIAWPGN